jgi:hypothetical protein
MYSFTLGPLSAATTVMLRYVVLLCCSLSSLARLEQVTRRPLRSATLLSLTGISLCDVCSCYGMLRAQRTRVAAAAARALAARPGRLGARLRRMGGDAQGHLLPRRRRLSAA